MYESRPYKIDKAENIGPNIVPVSVFVKTGRAGRKERMKVKWRGGVGATAVLMNVSRAVWGSSGYQGAPGAHSVVFCS